MQSSDQLKLIRAGFTIIRQSWTVTFPNPEQPTFTKAANCVIKAKTIDRHEWFNYETGFPSKAAMKRRVQELLREPNIVEE